MLRIFPFCAWFVILTLFAIPTRSYADIYAFYPDLETDQGVVFVGMDAQDDVILSDIKCAPTSCFIEINPRLGTGSGLILTEPYFVPSYFLSTPYVGGSLPVGCTPPSGLIVTEVLCSSFADAFIGTFSGEIRPHLYISEGSGFLNIDQADPHQQLYMDALGDILWDDVFANNWVEAVDLTTAPEPSSLLLLGTGLVGVVAAARRRLNV